jgi:uncharacterized protein with HEPN domain
LKRRSELYLRDIVRAIDTVQQHVGSKDFAAFRADAELQYTVLWNLQIIGEACVNIASAVRERHPEVPWREIQDLRVVIVHRYWTIYLEEIWDIVEHKLRPLREQISAILESEEKAA